MAFRGDERAQTVQIGAVLLFATIIIAISLYQATVVPQENQQVEFAAYQEASADMLELRNALLATASGDGARGVTFKTGAQYPPRTFLMNGLDPRGRVTTSAPANVTFGNVDANASAFENVGAYVTTERNRLNYTSRRVRFQPDYNHVSAADLVSTNGFVYRDHDNATQLAPQTLIRGNTITLTTLAGNLDADGLNAPITAVPVSAHVNTVTVTNESNGPLNITLPTNLSATEWNETVLGGVGTTKVQNVTAGPRPNTVTVELEPNVQYELRVAKVELRERDDDDEVTDPPARYIVAETDRDATVNSDGRVKLVVEARDALNNPRSNAVVDFSVTGGSGNFETRGGDDASLPLRTNEEGDAVVWFDKDPGGDATVTATLQSGEPGGDEQTVQWTVSEPASGNGSSTPAAYTVDWLEGVSDANNAGLTCSGESCQLDLWETQTATLYVGTSPVADNAIILTSVNDTDVASLSGQTASTNTSGVASTDLTGNADGTVKVYASSGGSGDVLTVRTNTGVVYNEDGLAVSPPSGGERSAVQFSVTNNRGVDLVVTDIRVNPSDAGTPVARLDDPVVGEAKFESEFFVETPSDGDTYVTDFGGGQAVPSTFDLSTASNAANEHLLEAGETGNYTLYEFIDGSDTSVNMTGRNLTMTLFFADGTSKEFVVTPEAGTARGGGKAQDVEIVQAQINNGQIDIQFRNNNAESVTFTRARLDSYTENNPPSNPNRDAIDRVIYRPGVSGPELVEGDPLESVGGPTVSNGANEQVTLQPQRIDRTGGGPSAVDANAESGDSFQLTIEFDDGSTRTYTVTL